MSDQVEMDMQVNQAGQDGFAARVYDRCAIGDRNLMGWAACNDAIAFHKHSCVMNGRGLIPVYQHAAGNGVAFGCILRCNAYATYAEYQGDKQSWSWAFSFIPVGLFRISHFGGIRVIIGAHVNQPAVFLRCCQN